MLAQASIYHLYKEKYFKQFGGQVGITLESPFYMPKDSSVTPEDQKKAMDYRLGWFANPLFGTGGYPPIMVKEIAERSAIEGRPFSRLPEFTEEQKKSILGSADFFGMNYYTSAKVEIKMVERNVTDEPSWFADSGVKESADPNWKVSNIFWFYSVPDGFRSLFNWIKTEYNNPPVFITENGWTNDGGMEDDDRIEYINSHLLAIAKAIKDDGCNIIGYTAWSLMDSFEWNSGYTIKYGLYYTNLTSAKRERVAKKSVTYLQNIIKTRTVHEMT